MMAISGARQWQTAFVAMAAAGSCCSGQWYERQKFHALAPGESDHFGRAIAIDGGSALMGSPGRRAAHFFDLAGGWWVESQAVTGTVDFGRSVSIHDGLAVVGSAASDVRMYTRGTGEWVQSGQFTTADLPGADRLGWSVSVAGTRAIAGSPYADTDGQNDSGTAWAFRFDGGAWLIEEELPPPLPLISSHYGDAAASTADWILVGASLGYGFRGGTGVAFLFDSTDIAADPVKLAAADGQNGDVFGASVAINGETALIGAPYHDDGGNATGSVYVFRRVGGEWVQHQKLTAPDAGEADFFGNAVAIDGATAVVGAEGAEKVYLFHDDGLEWSYVETLTAGGVPNQRYFGSAVGIAGVQILVGAYGDDFGASNGGSVYAFSTFCAADWNADGTINTIDVMAFLNDWTRRRSHCDLNRDGAVNTQDFLSYLNAWAAGC